MFHYAVNGMMPCSSVGCFLLVITRERDIAEQLGRKSHRTFLHKFNQGNTSPHYFDAVQFQKVHFGRATGLKRAQRCVN
jgi:hypothetical protein